MSMEVVLRWFTFNDGKDIESSGLKDFDKSHVEWGENFELGSLLM